MGCLKQFLHMQWANSPWADLAWPLRLVVSITCKELIFILMLNRIFIYRINLGDWYFDHSELCAMLFLKVGCGLNGFHVSIYRVHHNAIGSNQQIQIWWSVFWWRLPHRNWQFSTTEFYRSWSFCKIIPQSSL